MKTVVRVLRQAAVALPVAVLLGAALGRMTGRGILENNPAPPTPSDRACPTGDLPTLRASAGLRTGPGRNERPYRPGDRERTRLHAEDGYEDWELEEEELRWLLSNEREVLLLSMDLRPERSGGVRILRIHEDSFPALRGLKEGDLLVDINGRPIDDPEDVEDWIRDPAYAVADGLRVTLERAGNELIVDYRRRTDP